MNTQEIPSNLKRLYKHWDLHIGPITNQIKPESICQDQNLLKEILWFIGERIAIWQKKIEGGMPPHTDDPILATYKFTNIFREFDRQTIEFHTLLNPLRDNFPLWLLNMFYCRMVARPETIRYAGLLSFDKDSNKLVYEKLIHSPRPRYGTPYVFPISVIQRGPTPTRELFIAKYLPSIMEGVAMEIMKWKNIPVYEGVEKVLAIFKYRLRFHWTEVLIDTAYQFPDFINLFGRFPIGPGAAPTLAKIDTEKDPSFLVTELAKIRLETNITFEDQPLRLSAENWEGIACEFRKYTNLKQGKGRRRIYHS